jgi:RsiW-degrading membrane proteinase PrsW (M82 family)
MLILMAVQNSVTVPIHRPNLKEKLFFLLSGLIVSIPQTAFISAFSAYLISSMPSTDALILAVVILAPLIEEFSKAFPLFYRHGETERSIFTLGFLVGLGFGMAEFVEYVAILQAPIIERLPGIFFHASTASIIAYGIGRKQTAQFYVLAVILHLSANLFAIMDFPLAFVNFAVVFFAYFLSWSFYRKTQEHQIPY